MGLSSLSLLFVFVLRRNLPKSIRMARQIVAA
jgi:Na+-transporting NADH:ubiquinone oxidoreductase subunit NqrD